MKTALMGLLAETFIHPGSGQNEGAIDLPVARERSTNYPFIAGSSLKGALLDGICQRQGVKPSDIERVRDLQQAETKDETIDPKIKAKAEAIIAGFGRQDNAGELLIGDAQLLLLPVRSLSDAYRWVTCPLLLERLKRSLQRALGEAMELPEPPAKGTYLGAGSQHVRLYLEELGFTHHARIAADADWIKRIGDLIFHKEVADRLARQLVVLDNGDFDWFATNALPVHARNILDGETKESKNLWYEETLPPDTVMFSVISQRNSHSTALTGLKNELGNYLQAGGNETVGQGWFAIRWKGKSGEQADG